MAKKKVISYNGKDANDLEKQSSSGSHEWRNLIAFWFLGLCNNYGYVIMLSAAHDILQLTNQEEGDNHTANKTISDDFQRSCNTQSTGVILLADILPCLIIKFTSPFLPFYVNVRMFLCVLFSALGMLIVSLTATEWIIITGVVVTSISSGLGEVTLLSYSQRFSKDVISTWSSGTGGAGVIGALSYAFLKSWFPVRTTLQLMLVVPAIEAASFWLVLVRPPRSSQVGKLNTDSQLQMVDPPKKTIKEKFSLVPSLLKYMIPVGLVYFFEYFINQGLYELIQFDGIDYLDHDSQYRWLQVDYQIGVFLSRSSVNLFQINHIWLMAVFQFINVIVILFETIYYYIPNIWIVFTIILWEGMLGGAAYVNTFFRMSNEIRWEDRESALGIVTMADSVGIALAGWASMPVHNAICKTAKPKRLTF